MSSIAFLLTLSTLAALLGSCLVGGIFFAFSSFVMRALYKLPAGQGIAAMQAINIAVLNRSFLGVFFGTAVLCLIELALGALFRDGAAALLSICAAVLYLVGVIGVTVRCNVPRNDALARISPHQQSQVAWSRYVGDWTAWNHVRTLASLASAGLFGAALAFA